MLVAPVLSLSETRKGLSRHQSLEEERLWLHNLSIHLDGILQHVEPLNNPQIRSLFFQRNSLQIWIKAFTHLSYYADGAHNYEDLEYKGDLVLKSTFGMYLMKRFPRYHKDQYTSLDHNYMSQLRQAMLCEYLGLSQFIRTLHTNVVTSVKTDVFESFFGAVQEIAEMVAPENEKFSFSMTVSWNLLNFIFNKLEIDTKYAKNAPRTLLEQICTRFTTDKPISNRHEDGEDSSYFKTNIFLTKNLLKIFNNYRPSGYPENNELLLGTGRGVTTGESIENAYYNALDNLKSRYDMDTERSIKIKFENEMSNNIYEGMYPRALQKVQQSGFSSFNFVVLKKSKDDSKKDTEENFGIVVQMIAYRDDGTSLLLKSIINTNREDSRNIYAQKQLLQEYLSS
jgi:dsRNA-specific ribonuclease